MLPFHDPIFLGKNRAQLFLIKVESQLPPFSILYPGILKFLEVASLHIELDFPFGRKHVVSGCWKPMGEKMHDPHIRSYASDCEGREVGRDHAAQIAHWIMVRHSSGFYGDSNNLIKILIVSKSNACRPHRSPTSTGPISIGDLIPIRAILIKYLDGPACCLAWCPSTHPFPALLVLFGNVLTYLLMQGLSRRDQPLGCGDMHDGVVAVAPVHAYFQVEGAFVFGH